MIVILLMNTSGILGRPSISKHSNNNLCLCEDGLDREDSARIVYACPCCLKWLFFSYELKWADKDGYWRGPFYTLQGKDYYRSRDGRLDCPDCGWWTIMDFFSTFG